MKYIKVIFFLIIGFLYSCTSEDDKLNIEDNITIENLAPKNFEITIKDISHSSAKITWNAAIDPENDQVKYDIYLNNVKVFSDITNLEIIFENLEELKNYSGYIIAKDTHDNETRSDFNFITFKYYLKFIKDYDYGPNKSDEEISSIVLTDDNNYLVSGIHSSNVFVFKINTEGDLIWSKYLNFFDERFYLSGNKPIEIINSNNNGSILTYKHYLIQLDKNGNEIWRKDFREIYGNDKIILLESLKYDNQNNLIVVGSQFKQGTRDRIKGAVVKFSPNKNLLWFESYELDYFNYILDFALDKNNNMIIYGSTTLEDDEYGRYSSAKFWLFKIDQDGNKIFEKKFGDGHCIPLKIINTMDNNFVIQGFWLGAYDRRFDIINKIDQEGNFIWEKTFERDEIVQSSVAELSNSDILISGKIASGGLGVSNIAYIKLSSSTGENIWNKHIPFDYSYTNGVDIVGTNDGGFAILSNFSKNFYEYYSKYPNPKILLLKSDPDGNIN